VSDRPTDPIAAQLDRAQALVELRRYDEARSVLTELIGREPDVALAWCLLAQAQIAVDDPKAALEAAERAAALEPGTEWPLRLRSVALQELGDTDGSIGAAREAVAAGPYTWQTHVRLATALVSAKRNKDEALAAADRAVALAPHEPTAFFALGLANDMRGNGDEAERCYRQALAIDPQHAASINALSRRQLGSSRFGRAGNLAGAAAGFRDAVRVDPRADYAAKNLELVLRLFIARVSYLIFIVAWIAIHAQGGTLADRAGPLLLLAIPVAFAIRFLAKLAPDLRRHVGYVAFHGRLAVPSVLQSCAVVLLVVSAVAPDGARAKIGVAAVLTSLAARIVLYLDTRRRRRAPN
jgi:tetratricopeptide (TPR) repeat protein